LLLKRDASPQNVYRSITSHAPLKIYAPLIRVGANAEADADKIARIAVLVYMVYESWFIVVVASRAYFPCIVEVSQTRVRWATD
jgi:hypothetical protein